MFPGIPRSFHRRLSAVFVIAALILLALLLASPVLAQSGSQGAQSQQTAPPEAGGPQGDIGPIAIPKKTEQPPPPPEPTKPKKIEGMPEYSLKVDVPVVTLDVMVTTKDGHFIPGLTKDHFRILEDGVPQKVTSFGQAQAPITAVLLVEFAATNYYMMYDMLNASYNFANTLKKDDWVALVSYDMKPQIVVDFTQDKRAIFSGLNRLRIPGFRETNEFDALYDTIDRLERIEGRKYIVLISSGYDSFSKLTYDQILKKVKGTQDITIYTISTGAAIRIRAEASGRMSTVTQMDYLQADNEMRTFAALTGGRWFAPRFEGELPGIFQEIGNSIRNEYTLSYHPTNPKLDGSFRKLKVELVGPDGSPLIVKDEKGKQLKYQILARDGYTAKHQVE